MTTIERTARDRSKLPNITKPSHDHLCHANKRPANRMPNRITITTICVTSLKILPFDDGAFSSGGVPPDGGGLPLDGGVPAGPGEGVGGELGTFFFQSFFNRGNGLGIFFQSFPNGSDRLRILFQSLPNKCIGFHILFLSLLFVFLIKLSKGRVLRP